MIGRIIFSLVSFSPAYAAKLRLPSCTSQLSTCQSGLTVCESELTTCNQQLATDPIPGDGQAGTGMSYGLNHGPDMVYVDHGDGTFTDTNTALMWEKKTGSLTVPNSADVHDAGNTFTWSITQDLPGGTVFTDFLSALNTIPCFAGHCDWRIPTIKELFTLFDYTTADPATRVPGITEGFCYWTVTTFLINPNYA